MKQMLVHVEGNLLQTAVLHEGQLIDFFMEKSSGGSLVGNIYKGKIVNVLPGMGAAFVDIGLGRNAFLYIDDLLHPHTDKQPREKPAIQDVAKPGQELLVQVVKDPLGGKGARVTTHYNLPGRYLVYMPLAGYVGVSKKIAAEAERERLRLFGEGARSGEEGIILRTAAEGENEEALGQDAKKLRALWYSILERGGTAGAPELIHSEARLLHRIIRDSMTDAVDEVWIDHKISFQEMKELLREMAPALSQRLHLYQAESGMDLFHHFHVSEQLEVAFSRRVPMASGGYLVWEETEALTVVDVNTGRFTGTHHLEDTVYQTNREAAELISRLLRLRDVGGMVIIDFIDMEQEESRQRILSLMTEEASKDGTKCTIVGWTRLGLMELTRKKMRENAIKQLGEDCRTCGGTGKQPKP
ncbi:Rne/Rng family ribonuclease [Paenibacillus sp. HB172176]|uniref:Rne/Rng family ribonuclease n=1 Tax=Paenibacillus sp. HB172176 TaxID=2493690 RepID=UPI001439263D|nr:Rne/Rng family ribonuclease [Paenibacillus sp. HB172176]